LPSSVRGPSSQGKLANEAFLIANGAYHVIHHSTTSHGSPAFECSWFTPEKPGFEAVEYGVGFA
jgi:hypothetical protein